VLNCTRTKFARLYDNCVPWLLLLGHHISKIMVSCQYILRNQALGVISLEWVVGTNRVTTILLVSDMVQGKSTWPHRPLDLYRNNHKQATYSTDCPSNQYNPLSRPPKTSHRHLLYSQQKVLSARHLGEQWNHLKTHHKLCIGMKFVM
jgi:hypothetical protein